MTDNNGYVTFKGLSLSILLIAFMMVGAPLSYAFFVSFENTSFGGEVRLFHPNDKIGISR